MSSSKGYEVLQAGPNVYGKVVDALPPAPMPPLGFSNKPGPEGDCHVSLARCSYPLFFCSSDRTTVPANRKEGSWYQSDCCNTKVSVQNVQMPGTVAEGGSGVTSASFRYSAPYGWLPCLSSCLGPSTMHVYQGADQAQVQVGTVQYDPRCFTCHSSRRYGAVATNTAGQTRFQRLEPSCMMCCDGSTGYGCDLCPKGCYREKTWPISDELGMPLAGNGGLRFRQHAWAPKNYPMWLGYKEWPQGADSTEDRLLLTGIALMHWIHMGNTAENQGRLK